MGMMLTLNVLNSLKDFESLKKLQSFECLNLLNYWKQAKQNEAVAESETQRARGLQTQIDTNARVRGLSI
jgi:hypothetical protein